MNEYSYRATATTTLDGLIQLEEQMGWLNEPMKRVSTQIMDTRDKAVRDALIALGWTPPGALRTDVHSKLEAKEE